jgi:superfamily II DNA or RNA helicase
VDECHHTPSKTFTEAVNAFPAMYRLGLTATPSREDGLGQAIQVYIGPFTGWIEKQDLIDNGYLCEGEAVFFQTGFTPVADPSGGYSLALLGTAG